MKKNTQKPTWKLKSLMLFFLLFFLISGNHLIAQDADNDGIADAVDLDADNDGILDANECSQNVLVNPSFEVFPSVPPQQQFSSWGANCGSGTGDFYQFDAGDVEGWYTNATDNAIEIWGSYHCGGDPAPTPSYDGGYHIEICANENASLFQTLTTNPGDEITWSIWHRGRRGIDVAEVWIGPTLATTVFQETMSSDTVWTNYTGTFIIPIGQITTVFEFKSISTSSGSPEVGNFIDLFEVNVCKDSDSDGVFDYLDLDSDNDGIPDLVEAGGVDTDGDGKVDGNIDSDGDGIPDYADPDAGITCSSEASAPGDGICDEVQSGASGASNVDTDNDGIDDAFDMDVDGDGLLDTYDSDSGGNAIPYLDSDNDGIVDANDLDADNDGIPDIVEAGGTDVNGDGIADGYVDTDMDGFNDVVDGDVGNDGAENTTDALVVTGTDTNADGIPDSFPSDDTDGDGILDHLDLDADNDGIPDVVA